MKTRGIRGVLMGVFVLESALASAEIPTFTFTKWAQIRPFRRAEGLLADFGDTLFRGRCVFVGHG